ncbi:transposase domain-containing protein [bacterium]|nr:transposase domain-containing protein [bacterium]
MAGARALPGGRGPEIDNNAAERALRRVALGRKNWLFAGSDEGGRRAAIIYTMIASCQRHGVEPFAYLRDVLGRIPSHLQSRIEELCRAAGTLRRHGPRRGAPGPTHRRVTIDG